MRLFLGIIFSGLVAVALGQSPIRKEWSKVVIPPHQAYRTARAQAIFPAPDDGVYAIVSNYNRSTNYPVHTRLIRLDSDGNVVWNILHTQGSIRAVDKDFNLYIELNRNNPLGGRDNSIRQLGSDGTVKWQTEWITTPYGIGLSVNPDGYFAVTANSGQSSDIHYFSPSGSHLWQYRVDPHIVTGIYNSGRPLVNEAGDVFVAFKYHWEVVHNQLQVLKLSSSGIPLWRFDEPRPDEEHLVGEPVSDKAGGVFIHYYTYALSNTGHGYVQAHINSLGMSDFISAPVQVNRSLGKLYYLGGKLIAEQLIIGRQPGCLFGVFNAQNGAQTATAAKVFNLNPYLDFAYTENNVFLGWTDYESIILSDGGYDNPISWGIHRYTAAGTLDAVYEGPMDQGNIVVTPAGTIWSAGAMLGYHELPYLHEGFRLTKFMQNSDPAPDRYVARQSYRTGLDESVLSNDLYPASGRAALVSSAANGSLTLNANGSFSYIPNANFAGTDRFTYKVVKPGMTSPATTVTLTVPALFKGIRGATSVIGGNRWDLNLDFNYPVGSARATAELSASSSEVVAPPRVTLVEGLATKVVSIPTNPVAYDTEVAVQVRLGGVTKSMFVTVRPATLSSLTLSAASVRGGLGLTGLVTLSGKAPAGGAEVDLVSNRTSVVVPRSMTVAAGRNSGTFAMTTTGVAANTTVTISALMNSVRKTATVQLLPPDVVSIASSTNSVRTGGSVTFTVTLNGRANAGVRVTLVSSNRLALPTPTVVTVPANATTVRFTVRAGAVARTEAVRVTATRGLSKTVSVTVSR